MADTDFSRTKPRKEIKKKLASTVTASFQTPRDKSLEELHEIVRTLSDKGLDLLTVTAICISKTYPAQSKQNALIISMTEWRAAKAEAAA